MLRLIKQSKWIFSYSEKERRANVTAVNLFFSALLGTSLGSMGSMGSSSLHEYAFKIIVLAGAVTAIFTIAFTERRRMMVTMTITLAILFAFVISLPGVRLNQDMQRLSVMLAIWLGNLLLIRFTPAAGETRRKDPTLPEEEAEPSIT